MNKSNENELLTTAEDKNIEKTENLERTFWDYVETKNGHEIAKQVLGMLSDIKSAATQAMVEEKKARLEAEIHYKKFQSIIQLSVFTIGLFVVGGLTYVGKFESGIAMLVGTLVGYFFGKSKNA